MLLSEAELMEKFNCKTRKTLVRRLDRLRIKYLKDDDCVVTTLDAINAPLWGKVEELIEFK